MNNPYEPPQPQAYRSPADPYVAMPTATVNKLPFILAGVGALAASAFWGVLTLLIVTAAATGSASPTQVILPVVLIGLYAYRGIQLFKCNPAAARSMLWLQGIGAIMAVLTMLGSGGTIVAVLYGVKLVVHVFGAAMSLWALKSGAAAVSTQPWQR